MSESEKTRQELLEEIATLRKRDDLLCSILENVPGFVITFTPEGKILSSHRFSPGVVEHPSGLLGTSIYQYILPEFHEVVRECIARVVSTGEPSSFDAMVMTSRRDFSWYETRVGPLTEDGQVSTLLLIATDITRRKEAERDLRESREALPVAITAAGIGLWSADPHTWETTWDTSLKRLLGFPEDAPNPSQEACFAMVHPEDYHCLKDAMAHISTRGVFEEFEIRFKDVEGKYRWFLTKGSLFYDEQGKPAKLLGGGVDITRRKHVEEERDMLAALVENSNDLIALASLDGIVRYINPAGQKLVGLTDPERIKEKKSLLVLFPPEERPALLSLFAVLKERGRYLGTSFLRNFQTGETIPIEYNAFVIQSEGGKKPLGLALVARDMTEHKRAEEARERLLRQEREQRERAALLAEASKAFSVSLDYPEPLEVVARLAVPHLANAAVIDLADEPGTLGTAYPTLVVSGDPELERLMQTIIRCYPTQPAHPVMQVMRNGQALLSTPEHNPFPQDIAQDEEQRRLFQRFWPFSLIVVPLEARGQRFGVFGLIATDRVYNEEDLALAADLGQRVALAVDNARLYREARAAVRARDEFLSVASHELRTPLTPLSLKLQLLLRLGRKAGEEKIIPQEVLSQLESMQKQLSRLRRLIDELLDLSRLTEGRLTLEMEELDLVALVREILERSSEEIKRVGSTLILEAPETLSGRWDRLRLDQVITNLLSNAIKYGEGRPIEVRLQADNKKAHLSVRDHGLGIAPGDQERIFGRFERAVSERHYGGFGLGLWITRQIIEAMGGSISVESYPGQGSLFRLVLPR